MELMEMAVALWLLCTIATPFVASSRGWTNGTLWTVMGLVLGPVGLALAWIGPAKAQPLSVAGNAPSPERMNKAEKICPCCNIKNPKSAFICGACQSRI